MLKRPGPVMAIVAYRSAEKIAVSSIVPPIAASTAWRPAITAAAAVTGRVRNPIIAEAPATVAIIAGRDMYPVEVQRATAIRMLPITKRMASSFREKDLLVFFPTPRSTDTRGKVRGVTEVEASMRRPSVPGARPASSMDPRVLCAGFTEITFALFIT